jgi:hypothetical protein
MNRLAMKSRRVLLASAVVLAFGAAISPAAFSRAANEGASVTFRKVFKTSYPEFVEIRVNESGSGTFDIRQLDQESNPLPFEVSAGLAQRIFELAAKLHDFEGLHLDIHRRIANLGQKTFRYEKGGESHEVTFNYTLDESATQLLNIFEGLSRQELDLSNLQRTMRYDRLGVNDLLIQIEADYNNKLLPEPERLVAALDQIASDEKFVDIARQRARALAGHIRSAH